MASLGHPRPSVTASRQSRVPIALPPYEVPTNPLNQKAQNALHDLPRDHSLGSLKARMKAANAHLSHAAADINDRLQAKVEREEKGKRRREALSSPGSTDPGDEALEQMRQETEEMTVNLDQKIRDVIDSRAKIDGVEKILKELDSNVAANRGNLAPTQSTLGASQFRGPKRRLIASESDEEPDEDDSQLSMEGNGPILVLKRRIAEHDHAYHAESLTARYSAHNDYIGFKNLVHDARHPGDNAPPVPHSSTWFPSEIRGTQSSASAGPGGTQHTDDDEDLRVASERISIKCPITLRPMRNPVSSKNCVHNFEKEAILEMINVSDIRVGGEKAMKCPVCEVILTTDDLVSNPVLIRKIQRIQAAENAQNDDSDGGDSNDRTRAGPPRQDVTSSPAPTMASIKRERMSRARSIPAGHARREVSMVPNTQRQNSTAEDVLPSDEEDEDDDAEDEYD